MTNQSLLMRKAAMITAIFFLLIMSGMSAAFGSTVRITEWMYKGTGSEFIEITNIGETSVDLTGWSYDDESATPGVFDMSGFGTIAAGESVILTEGSAGEFRTEWGLSDSVKVLGGVDNNLGKNDAINIFDNTNALVDKLTYGPDMGSISASGASGNPVSFAALGADDASLWVLSEVGDRFGSYASIHGDVGNPGTSPVPVPGALWLLGSGLLAVIRLRKNCNER